MNKQILASLFCCLFACIAAGQNSAPLKPTPPFLARMPADTRWAINFTPAGSRAVSQSENNPAPKAGPFEKQLIVTRAAGIRQELISLSDGTSSEMWLVRGAFLIKGSGSKNYAILMARDTPYPSGELPDFPDLNWVDLQHFKGVAEKNGQQCYIYQSGIRKISFPTEEDLPPATLWVSVDTKLPVAIEDNASKGVYIFNLPLISLALPPECQKLMEPVDAFARRLSAQKMVLPP